MPCYEYKCENCGDVFELMQKFADTPLTEHTKCGGKVHRIISAPALMFKGSGWYVNDYAKGSGSGSNGPNKEGGSGKKDEGGSSKKDDGKSKSSSSDSGSKPAATTTTSAPDTKSSS